MARKKTHPVYQELGMMMRLHPFRPFDIKTADGDAIHVFHRDFVARSPTGETAIVYDKDGHFRIVHLNMVVTLEPTRPKGTQRPGRH